MLKVYKRLRIFSQTCCLSNVASVTTHKVPPARLCHPHARRPTRTDMRRRSSPTLSRASSVGGAAFGRNASRPRRCHHRVTSVASASERSVACHRASAAHLGLSQGGDEGQGRASAVARMVQRFAHPRRARCVRVYHRHLSSTWARVRVTVRVRVMLTESNSHL